MIIEVVGKEIEKIKGDFESYLNGLNMVGEISYSQYSKLYDEGTKQIQRAYELGKSELEKENAELKAYNEKLLDSDIEKHNKIVELEKELEQTKKVQVVEHFEAYGQCRDSRRIAGLETENAELKETIHKAEEIIRGLYFIIQGRIDYENNIGIADEMWRARQFFEGV